MSDQLTTAIMNELERSDCGADLAPIAQWADKKNRTVTAHTMGSVLHASLTVRDQIAVDDAAANLDKGYYMPFYRDVLAALSKGHRVALASKLNGVFPPSIDATTGLALSFQADQLELVSKMNKAVFGVVAEFVAAPAVCKKVKGAPNTWATVAKPFARGKQWFSAAAAAWLESEAARIAGKSAPEAIEA